MGGARELAMDESDKPESEGEVANAPRKKAEGIPGICWRRYMASQSHTIAICGRRTGSPGTGINRRNSIIKRAHGSPKKSDIVRTLDRVFYRTTGRPGGVSAPNGGPTWLFHRTQRRACEALCLGGGPFSSFSWPSNRGSLQR